MTRVTGSLRPARNRSVVGAWAVIQAGGTGKLHSSYNVASYTDNGDGDHSLSFVIPFASASQYAVLCSSANINNQMFNGTDESNPPLATSLRVLTINASNVLVDVDPTMVMCVGRR